MKGMDVLQVGKMYGTAKAKLVVGDPTYFQEKVGCN